MSPLHLLSVDRKAIPLVDRAAFTHSVTEWCEGLYRSANEQNVSVMVLNTCERFEVYASAELAESTRPVVASQLSGPFTTVYQDRDAVQHLFRVASGLKSRIVGESQILGQVRASLSEAQSNGAIAAELTDVIVYAIRCGRRVRSQLAIGSWNPEYGNLAVERLQLSLNGLNGRKILVIGSGELAADVARTLMATDAETVTLSGRHEGRVSALAQEVGVNWIGLKGLSSVNEHYDAIVTAVAAATPVVGVAEVEALGASVLIDLGGSPNVELLVDQLPGVTVVRLDDLVGRIPAIRALAAAEQMVEQEVQKFISVRWAMAGSRRRMALRAS